MLARRTLLAVAACAAIGLASGPSFAAEPQKFDVKAFKAAQAAGKSIVVEVHADWCPVCARQKPIAARLRQRPDYRGFAFFEVDFDKQKDALALLRVTQQSTVIGFKGSVETGRATGVTDPAAFEDIWQLAI